jgi:hypothetical protein
MANGYYISTIMTECFASSSTQKTCTAKVQTISHLRTRLSHDYYHHDYKRHPCRLKGYNGIVMWALIIKRKGATLVGESDKIKSMLHSGLFLKNVLVKLELCAKQNVIRDRLRKEKTLVCGALS